MKNGRSETAPTVDRMRFARHLEAHSWEPVVEVAQTLTPAASRLSPLVRRTKCLSKMGFIVPHRSRRKLSGFTNDKVLVENGFIVPLTKGDSREAAGGQGLSHFYHGLLGLFLKK